jgi:hypothetical protein
MIRGLRVWGYIFSGERARERERVHLLGQGEYHQTSVIAMDLSPRQRVSVSLSRRHLEEKLPGSRIVGCEASLDAWKAFTLRNPKHGHSLTSVSLDTSIRPSQRIMPNALFIIVVAGPWVRSFSDCSFCLRCQRCYAIWAGNRTVHTQWNQTLQHIAPERTSPARGQAQAGKKQMCTQR